MLRFDFGCALFVCSTALFAACGSSESPATPSPSPEGGPSGTGGAAPGSGGSVSTGGTRASGGASGGGGASTGGAASGGASTDGGSEAGADAGAATLFVDVTAGKDTNDGTKDTPYKTIGKALEAARTLAAPQTIALARGTYDSVAQGFEGSTPPPGTTIQGFPGGGVTLHGSDQSTGFIFAGGGAIHDVTFDTFATGVSANGTGTFSVSGVHFKSVATPLIISGSLKATVDASGPEPFATPPPGGFGLAGVTVDGTAELTFTGGSFENITAANGGMFLARGSGKLTIDGTVFDTLKSRALSVFDNADVVLKNVQIHNVDIGTNGTDNAAIAMGAQNTAPPIDPSLELQNTDITLNKGTGIALTLYGNLSSKPVIKLTAGHVDGNTGNGIWIYAPAGADPALVATVQANGTTFRSNTLAGITADTGAITLTQVDVSLNGVDGVALTGASFKNSLKVRGATVIDQNAGYGVSFAGAATSTLDLGKMGDPGGITFTGVLAGHSAVNLGAAIQGFAVGNTWMPSVQGANATGLFTTPNTIASGATGLNATVGTGATLVVSQ